MRSTQSKRHLAKLTKCWAARAPIFRSPPVILPTSASLALLVETLPTPSKKFLMLITSTPTDLERVPEGETFRWYGRYDYDLNVAHTLDTKLNVFADFKPKLSAQSKSCRLVFLGNIQPDLQREVREQIPNAELVALDTMNLWIDITRESLMKTIQGVDVVIINDAEARQLTEMPNLIKAARAILSWGPQSFDCKTRRIWRGAVHQRTATLRFPRIRSNPFSIRPAPATLSLVALWDTFPASRHLTKRRCGGQ